MTTDLEKEREALRAERDAEICGIGYLVDGVRVSPERVKVFYGDRTALTAPAAPSDTLDMSLQARLADAEADVARLHADKMALLERYVFVPAPQEDRQIACIVNELRDIAQEYGHTEQLRDRISQYIVPVLKSMSSAPQALPERDQSRSAERQGLFRKFDVRRIDGSDAHGGKHHGCRYFVLDMDHDGHAGAALAAYAAACESTHPDLARDLREKWGAAPQEQPSDDRAMLEAVMQDLDISAWQCPSCGHAEDCKTMDAALMLRRYLDASPSVQPAQRGQPAGRDARDVPDVSGAECCDECDRGTLGLSGGQKWCCYCGAKLKGTPWLSAQGENSHD